METFRQFHYSIHTIHSIQGPADKYLTGARTHISCVVDYQKTLLFSLNTERLKS